MASHSKTESKISINKQVQSRRKTIIQGYIRQNFDEKCMVLDILRAINEFYGQRGGSLYVFGISMDGGLGIEGYNSQKCKVPTLCPHFNQKHSACAVACYRHTLAVDTVGNVWSFGEGLGIRSSKVPTKLNFPHRAMSVAIKQNHGMILTVEGFVYSFGSNREGQLGHGDMESSSVPKCIESLKSHRIIQVALGGDFSVVVSDKGSVFTFGKNNFGQCGLGEYMAEKVWKVMTPTMIQSRSNAKVVQIECGAAHSLMITDKRRIYSWGILKYGACGHPLSEMGSNGRKIVYSPKVIRSLKNKKIIDCAAGTGHSLCVDKEGVVYSFGVNRCGQLGHSKQIKFQFEPKQIERIEYLTKYHSIRAKECVAGEFHSGVITQDGDMYVFGRNQMYQLGLDDTEHRWEPVKLKFPDGVSVDKVSMGLGYTTLIAN